MKKQFLLLAFILSYLLAFAQMPTDGNYSNWNWENQSQDNWRTKYGNDWTDIRPPFAVTTPRLGVMSNIDYAKDYTQAKGWKLVWAQFNGSYPWFALYNTHKSIMRVFFYLEDIPFTEVLATLSYQDANNPCLLSFGKQYQSSNQDYYNNSANSEKDMIAVVIRKLAPKSWGAADFPILYDKFITDSKYNNKKWEFTFYGCDNYGITLAGKSSTDPNKTDPTQDDQHTIVANKSAIAGNSLKADQAKLQKEIQSLEGFVKSMKDAANKIDTTKGFFNKKFFKDYVRAANSTTTKNLSGLLSFFSSLNSAAGAILGFANIITGSFDESSSTKPVAVIQYMNLQGSMNINRTLGGNTLSIPGLSSVYYPDPNTLKWNPYNCPMGIISLEKTPKIKSTTYNKYGYYTNLTFGNGTTYIYIDGYPGYPTLLGGGTHNLLTNYEQRYPGKIKKYKLDDDIVLAQQKINGLNLTNVRFAIVCKPNGTGDRKYSIKNQYLAYHRFSQSPSGADYPVPLDNPVYKALEDGRFIIHKFDEENDDIYFGTPYMQKNKLKGVVFEVPEDTDVKLAVFAEFSSDKYPVPIIFKALYNFSEINEAPQVNPVLFTLEQTNFKFSEYYNYPFSRILKGTYNNEQTACVVEMLPNFTGNNGFIASSMPFFKDIEIGNTIINETDFNCTSIQYKTSKSAIKSIKQEIQEDQNNLKPTLFPNPTTGILTISNPTKEVVVEVKVYTSTGQTLITKSSSDITSGQFDISSLSDGMYFVNLRTSAKSYSIPIFIKK